MESYGECASKLLLFALLLCMPQRVVEGLDVVKRRWRAMVRAITLPFPPSAKTGVLAVVW